MKKLALVLLLAACHDKSAKPAPCSPGIQSETELRDKDGKLELAIKPSDNADARDLCDPQSKRIGRVVFHGDLVTLHDPAGGTSVRLQKEGPEDWTATGEKGQLFRVHAGKTETRVLKPDGVAFGSVAPADGGATLYNAASAPVGSVAARDKDQVIAGTDGATQAYVVPAKSAVAAGFFAIPGLGLPERAVLYLTASKTAP